MATPDPSEVAPWYLRNINQALALDEASGNVYVRTGFTGNIVIEGNVNIPGNVDAHISEIGTSGILQVPYMPIAGNITIDPGQTVEVTQGTDPWNVTGNVTLQGTSTVDFIPTATDAFGRLRVSEPFTIFDTQSRYYDHNLFASNISGTGNVVYVSNQSSFQLNVGTTAGDSVIQETTKTFPYQPGKSQLTLNTFCMATPKTNLRQRVGLFSADDGVFFENDGTYNYMVIRSGSTGVEERVRQDAWNGDRLNGAGGTNNPSGYTLYPDRTQIFYADVEWLGVGTVRVGFVINGAYIICHSFNHANQVGNTKVYMTTATLPIRYEITNTGATGSSSMMTQICSSVISEGGFQLRGIPNAIGHNLGSPIRLPNDTSFKPLLAIRLKSSMPDAVVLPTTFTISPVAQSNFKYRIYRKAITSGGTWTDFGANSAVQYNLAPTAVTSGIIGDESFIISSNQSSAAPANQPLGFQFQLERDSFTSTMYEYVITAATTGTNQDVYASLQWEEVS